MWYIIAIFLRLVAIVAVIVATWANPEMVEAETSKRRVEQFLAQTEKPITRMWIHRYELPALYASFLRFVSLGRWNAPESAHHVNIYVEIAGAIQKIDKSYTIHIAPAVLPDGAMAVPIDPSGISAKALIDSAIAKMTPHHFYVFDTFESNCQRFVHDVLDANGLMTPELYTHIVQQLDEPPTYVQRIARVITDCARLAANVFD